MTKVQVRLEQESEDGYRFRVEIQEAGNSSHHRVSLTKSDYRRLIGKSGASARALMKASFEFLLEREPKEAILNSFDLTVIGRYFPEYETEIRKRLANLSK